MTLSPRHLIVGAALLAGLTGAVGCNDGPEAGSGAEPFQKLTDADKLQKIKAMPISPQMKVDGIKKLNLPEEEKQRAISEIMSSGGGAPGSAPTGAPSGVPSNPGSTG